MSNTTADGFSNLHITVGAVPYTQSHQVSLSNEIKLLKAALLYGDRVKFCGLASSTIVNSYNSIGVSSPSDIRPQSLRPVVIPPEKSDPSNYSTYITIYELKEYNGDIKAIKEPLSFMGIEKSIDQDRERLKGLLLALYPANQLSQLIVASQSGLVDFSVYDAVSENIAVDYMEEIYSSVITNKTFPLFDDFSENLLKSYHHMVKLVSNYPKYAHLLSESNLHIPQNSNAKQIKLCSELFSRLPSFEKCSVSEILDIRKELTRPLIAFRSAISSFAAKIENDPWTEGFAVEVEKGLIEDIAPIVFEIEDEVKSTKPLLKFAKKIAVGDGLGGGLSLLLSSVGGLNDLVFQPILTRLSTSTSLGLKEARLEKEKVQKNRLFFLYRLANMG